MSKLEYEIIENYAWCIDCDGPLDQDCIPYESQAGEGAPLYKGYLCTDCQLMECDKCGDATLDYSLKDNYVVCDWCTKQEQVKSRKK